MSLLFLNYFLYTHNLQALTTYQTHSLKLMVSKVIASASGGFDHQLIPLHFTNIFSPSSTWDSISLFFTFTVMFFELWLVAPTSSTSTLFLSRSVTYPSKYTSSGLEQAVRFKNNSSKTINLIILTPHNIRRNRNYLVSIIKSKYYGFSCFL